MMTQVMIRFGLAGVVYVATVGTAMAYFAV